MKKKKKKNDGGTAKGDGAHSTVEALAELRKKQAEWWMIVEEGHRKAKDEEVEKANEEKKDAPV